jgi:hypothetical protein
MDLKRNNEDGQKSTSTEILIPRSSLALGTPGLEYGAQGSSREPMSRPRLLPLASLRDREANLLYCVVQWTIPPGADRGPTSRLLHDPCNPHEIASCENAR